MQRLKLRRMRVRGFKSLADFDLRLPDDLMILIGANGAGKSSVLQSLAFVQYFAKGKPSAFFEDRGWTPAELRTRIKVNLLPGIVSYRLLLEHDDGTKIYWFFGWSLTTGKLALEEVQVVQPGTQEPVSIVSFSNKGEVIVGDEKISAISPEGSLVSILDPDALAPGIGKIIQSLHAWGAGIFSLELLSPAAMKRGARGNPSDIGPRGERLGGFLASLSATQKDRLVGRLAAFYPLQNIETTRKRAGWVDLRVAEAFQGIGRISAAHMSDGFMRMLGLASIPEFAEAASTVLLDEVEDGIEPHILPRFVSMIARESRVQIIVTSHSPILVNGFEPQQIAFVARQPDGHAVAAPFNSIDPLMEGLEYFGAGEIWTNTDMRRIGELVQEVHHSLPIEVEKKPKAESIKAFMGLL